MSARREFQTINDTLESGAEIVFAHRQEFHGQYYRVLLPDRRTGLKARFLHVAREFTVERAHLLGDVPTKLYYDFPRHGRPNALSHQELEQLAR